MRLTAQQTAIRTMTVAATLAVVLIGALAEPALATNTLIRTRLVASRPVTGAILPPSISLGQLVWVRTTGQGVDAVYEFHLYDATTGVDRVLMTRGGDGTLVDPPRLHSHRFVYAMNAPSGAPTPTAGWDVFSYDLYTGQESRLTTNPADQRYADIYGDTAVYEDNRNGDTDIYLHDFRDGSDSRITSSPANQTRPSAGYQYIAYQDDRAGNLDIRLFDIYERTDRRITSNVADQSAPSMADGVVVYEDRRWGNRDIYLYDVWGKVYRRLSSNGTAQHSPDASARRMVWNDTRRGNLDIGFFEMRFGTTHNLTADAASQEFPDLSGARVAYLQDGALMLADLRYPRLTIAAPSTVRSGSRATLKGHLRTDAGKAIARRTIIIQRSSDQMHWTTVARRTTSADGGYSYTTSAIRATRYYRVTYKGGDTYLSARDWSGAIKVRR
jgi:beta propeller repeat protein